MKELIIQVKIIEDKIATFINHKGFSDEKYTIEQIIETVGILEHLKHQMLNKIENKIQLEGKND